MRSAISGSARPALAAQHVALMVGAGLLVLALQIVAFHDLRHDDAYITYRYGQNLAQGNGFVFNPGERIMGSTSPAHAMLSAAMFAVVGKQALPSVMSAIGCVGWLAQAVALFVLLRRVLSPSLSLLVGLCVALGAAMSANWVALETHLAAASTLWAMVLALSFRWTAAGVVSALAGLVRPDAYLVAALLVCLGLFEDRKGLRRFALAFAVTSLPWLVFATLYFGTPLPQSAAAKIGTGDVGEYLSHIFMTPPGTALPFGWLGAWTPVAWLAAAAGAVFLIRSDSRLWLLPAYGGLHLAAYLALLPPAEHEWHLYPAVLVFVALFLSSVAALGESVLGARSRVRFGVAFCALLLLLSAYALRSDRVARRHGDFYWFGARDAAYRALSDELAARARPTDVVATYEIGTIGYYSELRIHDWFGLITRDPDLLPPDGCWMVSFWPDLEEAGGKPPTKTFRHARFTAYLYDLRNGTR